MHAMNFRLSGHQSRQTCRQTNQSKCIGLSARWIVTTSAPRTTSVVPFPFAFYRLTAQSVFKYNYLCVPRLSITVQGPDYNWKRIDQQDQQLNDFRPYKLTMFRAERAVREKQFDSQTTRMACMWVNNTNRLGRFSNLNVFDFNTPCVSHHRFERINSVIVVLNDATESMPI